MGEWRHRLSDVDGRTGTCSRCGTVQVVYRPDGTNRRHTPRCAVSVDESKDRAYVREVRDRWGSLPGGIRITIERSTR